MSKVAFFPPTSIASLPLPSGAATSSNQALEIADLDAMNARMAGSLVPKAFDEVVLTYNSDNNVATAVYKLATVTIKTLTLSYDGSKRLTDVVAS